MAFSFRVDFVFEQQTSYDSGNASIVWLRLCRAVVSFVFLVAASLIKTAGFFLGAENPGTATPLQTANLERYCTSAP